MFCEMVEDILFFFFLVQNISTCIPIEEGVFLTNFSDVMKVHTLYIYILFLVILDSSLSVDENGYFFFNCSDLYLRSDLHLRYMLILLELLLVWHLLYIVTSFSVSVICTNYCYNITIHA